MSIAKKLVMMAGYRLLADGSELTPIPQFYLICSENEIAIFALRSVSHR